MLSDRTISRPLSRPRLPAEFGETNPFLHLSMHLSMREQVSIDQPRGVKAAHAALSKALSDTLLAEHEMMECLAEMIWQSQRHRQPRMRQRMCARWKPVFVCAAKLRDEGIQQQRQHSNTGAAIAAFCCLNAASVLVLSLMLMNNGRANAGGHGKSSA